jgi:hypothetical protein
MSTETKGKGTASTLADRLYGLKGRTLNRVSALAYRTRGGAPSAGVRPVLEKLNRDGIAVTNVEELLGSNNAWPELVAFEEQEAGKQADEIERTRRAADEEGPGKSYLLTMFPPPVNVTPENDILVRFALQEPLLTIANAYYGMYAKLRSANIWHTFPSTLPARDSQLWHRDWGDRYILKVFVYLTEVGAGSGPFTYAQGTHPKGPIQANARGERMYGGTGAFRVKDEELAKIVPQDQWVRAIGPAGTIIFADTRGYHKGGESRDSERVMYLCVYRSPGPTHKEEFAQGVSVSGALTREQRSALPR